ncbi:hypothetical protein Dvina_02065 [Dactylosporangium vinaceum]|uniref:Uncharacterized protein n=1 Tax=Dactylosporangium vinaceum TaxID=53362 RepID=A0ABV5MF20_9ACTN|nr:hypothetical protein [Dactylosporangium vinaceum]UAB97022.1 hypothetical protein Dvina_02065 [Dactylosporangium vinaceum]
MTTLTALARALAVRSEAAQPITTVRHVHIADRPLVFIPLTLAGEANAPLAAMLGDNPDEPHLLIVPQPRNRDQRFQFAAALGHILVSYVDSFKRYQEEARGRRRYADAPQLLVPNEGGVGFLRLFGRSTRLRRTWGEYAVKPVVPTLGKWLTFFAEQAEYPGSSLALAMTSVLTAHWATGQSAMEDANLAALMAWFGPDPFDAAREAEDAERWPPVGPTTDPTFDAATLAPAMKRYDKTDADSFAREKALEHLTAALRSQLDPTWTLMWRGIGLLRALPPGATVLERWSDDRDTYTNYIEYLQAGSALPQPRRDSAVAAAKRLNRLERAQSQYDAQRALDDPLVMAEFRLAGEAFAGDVVAADPTRLDASGPRRKLRPHVTVRTTDPLKLSVGADLQSPSRRAQTARIVSIDGTDITLELTGGMGRALTPAPGSVPELGERVTYSTVSTAYQPGGNFPPVDETPWTHGGPPPPPEPTEEDAVETWS